SLLRLFLLAGNIGWPLLCRRRCAGLLLSIAVGDVGDDSARAVAAVDANFAFGLSAAFDGAARAGLSADVVLSGLAGLCGRADLRARAVSARADFYLPLCAADRAQPRGVAVGGLELRLWRNDSQLHRDVRIFDECCYVAAAGAHGD